MSNIGDFIKEKRKAKGLSQKKLGNICSLSDSEIMRIEKGVRKTPNWDKLCKMARALGCHPFEFLLKAGYISEKDIHPMVLLQGLENLDNKDIDYLQSLIDFMIFRKATM